MIDLPIEKERELAALALEEASGAEYFQEAMQNNTTNKGEKQ